MDFRKTQLMLDCYLTLEYVEELLTDNAIKSKFRKLEEGNRVREELGKLADSIKKLQGLAQKHVQDDFKVNSFEEVLRHIKVNCIAFTIGENASAIIFEGISVKDVVADKLSETLYFDELYAATTEIKQIIFGYKIKNFINGFAEDLGEEA